MTVLKVNNSIGPLVAILTRRIFQLASILVSDIFLCSVQCPDANDAKSCVKFINLEEQYNYSPPLSLCGVTTQSNGCHQPIIINRFVWQWHTPAQIDIVLNKFAIGTWCQSYAFCRCTLPSKRLKFIKQILVVHIIYGCTDPFYNYPDP